jgi:hypothetical protein
MWQPLSNELDDLVQTLQLARAAFDRSAHPIHIARLKLVERMVQRCAEHEPEYWREALAKIAQDAGH